MAQTIPSLKPVAPTPSARLNRPYMFSTAIRCVSFAHLAPFVRPALVNGAAGVVVIPPQGPPISVLAFTVRDGLIVGIDALADPERLQRLDLSALEA